MATTNGRPRLTWLQDIAVEVVDESEGGRRDRRCWLAYPERAERACRRDVEAPSVLDCEFEEGSTLSELRYDVPRESPRSDQRVRSN